MPIPFLEKTPQTEGNDFENCLDDKNHREDIIAVLQNLHEVLQDTQAEHI